MGTLPLKIDVKDDVDKRVLKERERIMMALRSHNIKTLEAALHATGPNFVDEVGMTPLLVAVRDGYVHGITALLAAGACDSVSGSYSCLQEVG